MSTIFTLNVPELRLPLASELEHVTVSIPNGKVDPDSGEQPTFGIGPSTMSIAVGERKFTFDPAKLFASAAISAGMFFSCGGVVSTTLMEKAAGADVLFEASLAVQETGVVPSGNVPPELLLHETEGDGSTASLADTANVAAAPLGPVASTVIAPGVFTVGAPRSTTLMVNVDGAEVLFDASFAVHDTVVVPRGNVWPELALQDTVGAGSMTSVAVTENVTAAPAGPTASAVIAAGTFNLGGVRSTSLTATVNAAVAVFVPSLAEQVTVVVPTANLEPGAGEQLAVIDPATVSVAVTGP